MQIVATNPLVIERNSLPIEIIEREKKIIKNKYTFIKNLNVEKITPIEAINSLYEIKKFI
ncbi:hypothetical protein CE195_09040 [Sodalis-like symbiont of Philaenus spumarius]|nr:hypothetical protein CE195_09040 [Sodalis-like symbiont of Philaenus spumarius]